MARLARAKLVAARQDIEEDRIRRERSGVGPVRRAGVASRRGVHGRGRSEAALCGDGGRGRDRG